MGWSLFAGGTISRTVRGLPDEQLVGSSLQSPGKVGLYHTSVSGLNNYYYQHHNDLPAFVYNNPYTANEYYWDITERGKFDTEHDLWQFNFMGKSGRFMIQKNMTNGLLEIIPLDDYRVKIIYNYQNIGTNPYIPQSFIIYDENGLKYVFDVVEKTTNKMGTMNIYPNFTNESSSAEHEFISSFQLTKIFDNNNNLVIEIDYLNNPDYQEGYTNTTHTHNDYFPELLTYVSNLNCFNEFKPLYSRTNSITNVKVKKINFIDIKNYGKINFNYTQGREDSNLLFPNKALKLNSIEILNNLNSIVKKVNFDYSYNTTTHKRIRLNTIFEVGASNQVIESYNFFYKSLDYSGFNLGKDNWGYTTIIPSCKTFNTYLPFEPNSQFSSLEILEKIKYKTKGSTVFDYEINNFSYQGDNSITDFKDNPENWMSSFTNHINFDGNNQIYNLPPITQTTKVTFKPSIVYNTINDLPVTLSLQKLVNGNWKSFVNLYCLDTNPNCCFDVFIEPNIQYRIKRLIIDPNYNGSESVNIEYYQRTAVEKQYLTGGGNRIKRIGYFSEEVPQDYFRTSNSSTIVPIKQLSYKYSIPTEPNKSSGSHVFALPTFKYNTYMSIYTHCSETATVGGIFDVETTTSSNNHSFLRTQGSDIGYKYVEVSEFQKGSTTYEYTSPIDFPEQISFSNTPPFLPSKNIDYKRGNLLKEITKSDSNKTLTEVVNTYSFNENTVKYGTRFHRPSGTGFQGQYFSSYTSYLQYLILQPGPIWGYNPGVFESFSSTNLPGYPSDYLNTYDLFEAYGWAKLTSKTTKNYFYPTGSNTPNIVQSTETFDYNPINKQIAEHTVTNSLNETLKTKYFYHTGNSIHSQNRIGEIERIETYRGADLISTNKINYSNVFAGNVSFLPQSISTSKGTNTLESRVKYNQYNQFGKPLEVQQENGTLISYIYGYNQTLPVAKLENMAYGSIPANLITAIQSATNTGTEASVISALNSLRTNANLANAMITTYTYKPLIGVSTITDPKGDTITYEYDSFGRLSTVKDKNGNILSENQYNYRTQN